MVNNKLDITYKGNILKIGKLEYEIFTSDTYTYRITKTKIKAINGAKGMSDFLNSNLYSGTLQVLANDLLVSILKNTQLIKVGA